MSTKESTNKDFSIDPSFDFVSFQSSLRASAVSLAEDTEAEQYSVNDHLASRKVLVIDAKMKSTAKELHIDLTRFLHEQGIPLESLRDNEDLINEAGRIAWNKLVNAFLIGLPEEVLQNLTPKMRRQLEKIVLRYVANITALEIDLEKYSQQLVRVTEGGSSYYGGDCD